MVEIYISRARKLLQKFTRMTKAEARDFALVNITDIIRSGKPNERNRALEAGFDEFWTKPLNLPAFLAGLDHWVGHKRSMARPA